MASAKLSGQVKGGNVKGYSEICRQYWIFGLRSEPLKAHVAGGEGGDARDSFGIGAAMNLPW